MMLDGLENNIPVEYLSTVYPTPEFVVHGSGVGRLSSIT